MLDKLFHLKRNKTSPQVEVIAGLTTFLAMAYIAFVNPEILSAAGMDRSALIGVTCLVTAVATIATGIFTNTPIAMAPGMGLNAFFAYSLVLGGIVNWETALGIVFLSGLLFLALTLLGARQAIVRSIPHSLVIAISVGLGIFITFIGLTNLGLVVRSEATLVGLGPINSNVLIGLFALLFIIILEIKKIKGSLFLGIIVATAVAVAMGKVELPSSPFAFNLHIQPLVFKIDIAGALRWSFISAIFSLMFMDLFDSLGTLVAVAQEANLVEKDGNIPKLGRLLTLDALATMFGALIGTSTTTSYLESAAGIESGGRTGLTAIITGCAFLGGLFFIPIIGIVPPYATAPALIMVGLYMMRRIVEINFKDLEVGIPCFLVIILVSFTYSISTGLAFGFIFYVVLRSILGKFKEISVTLWVIFALSLFHLILHNFM
ncbi:NCS2 family permease [Candidatus Aerophobetes bacterium]|nr:NCS2 family permease [Candidatus Aerophobetes bacterium]